MSEDAFLQAITADPAGPTSRLVYADWLDERVDPASAAKAEFLRLEVKLRLRPKDAKRLTKAEKRAIQARLLELRVGMDRDWLALLDRSRIENCAVEFAFRCPKQWESLQPTEDAQVRHCDVCEKHVYHCETIDEARRHAMNGDCIAVDSRLTRSGGDLVPIRMMQVGRPSRPREGERASFRPGQWVMVHRGSAEPVQGVVEEIDLHHRQARVMFQFWDRVETDSPQARTQKGMRPFPNVSLLLDFDQLRPS